MPKITEKIIDNVKSLLLAPRNLIFWALDIPLKPKWIVFMPTDACNSHCLHCSIWQQKPTRDILTLDEIEKIFSDKFLKKVKCVMLTGGEATVRADIKEVVLRIHKALPRASIQLSTNALLPERALETAKAAIDNDIDFEVGISFDGIGPDHDKARGTPGNFEKADWLVRNLVELRDKGGNKLKIAIGMVLSDFTIHSLREIREYAKKMDISLVEAWYNESSFYSNIGKHKFQSQIIDAVKTQPPSLIQEKWLKSLRGGSIRLPCFAMSTFCVLKCNGDIAPCLNLWDSKAGNVREKSISEIWKTKEVRKSIRRCKGCLNGWGAGWSYENSYYQILSFYLRHPVIIFKKIFKKKD
jgi:MoaA/NifB/PqqE/SkfB family radical SAM enzyme